MTIEAFALHDHAVACTASGLTRPIPFQQIATMSAAGIRILGLTDFHDAESIHAGHWEIHPDGDEILCVIDGSLAVIVEQEGMTHETQVEAGHAMVVPRACWHRLQVVCPGRLLFLTPAAGTSLRPVA